MNSICLCSVSLSRHSISASLVPTDSPKRFGKLHKTQVGGRRLLGQEGLSYSKKGLLQVPCLSVQSSPALVNLEIKDAESV